MITKKLRALIDARNAKLSEYLQSKGATRVQQRSNGVEFKLATPAGPWFVTLYDNWIATRFISQRGHRIVSGERSTSSKWNVHYEHDTPANAALQELKFKTTRALECRPSTLDRGLIDLEVAEYARRQRELREYLALRFGRGPRESTPHDVTPEDQGGAA